MQSISAPSLARPSAAAPVADLLRDIAVEIDHCAARIADGRDPVASAAAVQALGRLDQALTAVWAVLSADAAARAARCPGATPAEPDDARVEAVIDGLARLRLHIGAVRDGHDRLGRTLAGG